MESRRLAGFGLAATIAIGIFGAAPLAMADPYEVPGYCGARMTREQCTEAAAQANSPDDVFLRTLNSEGVAVNDDGGADKAISAAKRGCGLMASGVSDDQTLNALMADYPGMAVQTMLTTMEVGLKVYCPTALINPWSPPYASRGGY